MSAPVLYEVKPFEVPLATDHARVVRHAQRVAAFVEAYSAMSPRICDYADRAAYADLPPLAVALSWGVDLGRLRDGGGELPLSAVRKAAWPGSPNKERLAAALSADAPRYEAPSSHARCPVRGSRGGVCHERGARSDRWVTNLETGEWERRHVCDLHRPIAAARREQAPEPAPNRGGVLAQVFWDIDMVSLYRWACPHWVPPGHQEPPADVPVRREFRLVLGDVS